jgi:hypothetical protein
MILKLKLWEINLIKLLDAENIGKKELSPKYCKKF